MIQPIWIPPLSFFAGSRPRLRRARYVLGQIKGRAGIAWAALSSRHLGGCEQCGAVRGAEWEDSRTFYNWSGEGQDPNAPTRLCRSCATEHHAYWDERWAEVSGRY